MTKTSAVMMVMINIDIVVIICFQLLVSHVLIGEVA